MPPDTEEKIPYCNFPTDGTCLPIEDLINSRDCQLPPGSCFGIREIITDKHGHEVEGDWKKDSKGNWVPMTDECNHPDTPEYIAEHANDKVKAPTKIIEKETSIDTGTDVETITVVEIPKKDPVVPEKPPFSLEAALPLLSGAIAGVLSSVGGPMLMNLAKNLLKGKIKKPSGESSEKPEEETEEPTDCKTHQLKNNAKIISISKRITALEGKIANIPVKSEEDEEGFSLNSDDFEDFKDRIEKLEKKLLKKK